MLAVDVLTVGCRAPAADVRSLDNFGVDERQLERSRAFGLAFVH